MNAVALLFNDFYFYFHGIVIAFAIVVTIITSMLFCKLLCKGSNSMMLTTAVIAVPMGIACSRIFYCLCNYTEFLSLYDIFNMTDGGYSLYGAIIGVIIAVFIACRFDDRNSIGVCFDCIGVAAALGISIGKCASFFSHNNIGIVMNEFGFCLMPFSVYDQISGNWYLATFVFESICELLIFLGLWAALIDCHDKRVGLKGRDGDIGLMFLMMHGALESVADSMHTDALRFPFNSFVRMQQIIGAFCLGGVIIYFIIRSIKLNGFSLGILLKAIACTELIGITVYMEFDRISNTNYWFNHGIMLICLIASTLICVSIYRSTLEKVSRE